MIVGTKIGEKLRQINNNEALDLAELFIEKQKVDEKIEKLKLNQKKRNERKTKLIEINKIGDYHD